MANSEYGMFRSEFTGQDENGVPQFDRAVSEKFFQHYLGEFMSNGVFPNGYVPQSNNTMTVKITPGSIYVDNLYRYDDDPITFTFSAPATGNQTARALLRVNHPERTLNPIIIYSQVSNRQYDPPAIVRDEDIFDMVIFDVMLRSGQTQITAANIVDKRMDNAVCGMVFNMLQYIDTTELYNQIQGDLAEFKVNEQTSFKSWEAGFRADVEQWLLEIKDLIDDETAGRLSAAIADLRAGKYDKAGGEINGDVHILYGLSVDGESEFQGSAKFKDAEADSLLVAGEPVVLPSQLAPVRYNLQNYLSGWLRAEPKAGFFEKQGHIVRIKARIITYTSLPVQPYRNLIASNLPAELRPDVDSIIACCYDDGGAHYGSAYITPQGEIWGYFTRTVPNMGRIMPDGYWPVGE